jgi:hypothetical protein
MNEPMQNPVNNGKLIVWWVVWVANVNGLVVLYFILGGQMDVTESFARGALASGLGALALSCLLRWVVMPRQQDATKALVTFIIGAATAEACGIIGLLLGGQYRFEMFVLGLVGLLQWIPLFAGKFHAHVSNDVRDFRPE